MIEDEEQDILVDLVTYPTQERVLTRMLQRAAREIALLRNALRLFANWSNKITSDDIDNAKKMLEGQEGTLLETMVKMARGEL